VGERKDSKSATRKKGRGIFLFFDVDEFQFAILGVGILDLLSRVLETEGNVVFEGGKGGKRVEAAVTHVSYTVVFGPVCH